MSDTTDSQNSPSFVPRKNGRPKFHPDYERVEQLAACQLTVRQMAVLMGISEQQYYDQQREDAEFAKAIERGRAKACQKAAENILEAVNGKQKDDGTWETKPSLEWSAKYLRQHSEAWRETQKVELSGQVGMNVQIDDETKRRAARAFLQSQGEEQQQ